MTQFVVVLPNGWGRPTTEIVDKASIISNNYIGPVIWEALLALG
jgi:hypothetical protein